MNAAMNRTVSFGKPVTTPCLIPVEHKATPKCIGAPFMVNGDCYQVTALSFGTPHGAVIVNDVDKLDVPGIGASLGTHRLFPAGANIVFLQVLDGETIKARLWQREEGEAAYTSEAVCVAGTAAMMLQKILTSKVNVSMNGNSFQVEWDRGEGEVSLSGSALLLEAI